jgi:DNA/RNA-binding domain of Phe-tRNA-synthetase-like protein
MSQPFLPSVDPAIWALRPDFVALSLVARGAANFNSEAAPAPLVEDASGAWREAHIEAWRAAFRAFGCKPQRTASSVEALRRRFERDGTLPRINAVVDLYNALSVAYAVPIGGEDLARYEGLPRLTRAAGGEPFETVKDGAPFTEPADPGEVIWRDDRGVTCRRWNWRQGPRTRLDVATTEMWFVLERLEPMPLEGLEQAGRALAAFLRALAPTAQLEAVLLTNDGSGPTPVALS